MFRAILLSVMMVCTFSSEAAYAKTMVLIHGFQGQGMDWRFNGVSNALQSSGWVDGGNYYPTSAGVKNDVLLPKGVQDVFYTLDLPSLAPIPEQGVWLNRYLAAIYQQRREPLDLVAHSAGGIVARYWLVRMYHLPVRTLVTIATPHLGSPLSDVAKQLSRTPWADIAADFGLGEFRSSTVLLDQLREEVPGTFLYWLNHQPHPALRYVSLTRANQRPDQVDFIVPLYSQNMNNVYALHQRSEVLETEGPHFLNIRDGYAISQALSR